MGDIIQFTILRTLAELNQGGGGWHKLLTITAWSDGTPKLDLRNWQQFGDQLKPGRGVTLTPDEAIQLRDAIDEYLEEDEDQRER